MKIRVTVNGETYVRDVAEHLRFQETQPKKSCDCYGYPGIDWYQKKQRIALTSVQHCKALRWKQFPSDAVLTEASGQWLKQWLTEHGVSEDRLR